MPETLTTVRWLHETEGDQKTRFLLSHEKVHFILNERVKEERLTVLPDSAAPANINQPESMTLRVRLAEVRIPRVKPESAPPTENFVLLKKYEGFVTSRDEATFTARLFESANDCPVLEAEFDLQELLESDRKLAVEGAALVWTIGYHDESSRKRESLIYIRRRPMWNEQEIESETRAAQELANGIKWK